MNFHDSAQALRRGAEAADHIAQGDGNTLLPEVPEQLLARIFSHLHDEDKQRLLRHKIFPIAWLPHTTLFAKRSGTALHDGTVRPESIIAEISSENYQNCITAFLNNGLVEKATNGLRQQAPILSAHHRFNLQQSIVAAIFAASLLLIALFLPFEWLSNFCNAIFAVLFSTMIVLRLLAISTPEPSRQNLPRLKTQHLPVFSVLVPVFKETSVLHQLIRSLQNLNYPPEKLDIKIIVEAEDRAMHRALAAISLPSHFEILTVPKGKPQTKPRALNYALQFARGELVTIYDAEDIPEPMQLRIAASAFGCQDPNIACLQGELAFYNANENWLTRQFAMEYATLFRVILPALAALKLPLPLGGTSNHFKADALRAIGGWDPYNVTEDADLGIRFARFGYGVATLPSITYEEANTQVRNWVHQRSRWLKGFLQTWLVHMRHPFLLVQEVGLLGFMVVQAATLGVVIAATFHPVFLGLALYQLYQGSLTDLHASIPNVILNGVFLANLLLGFGVATVSGVLAMKRKRQQNQFWVHASLPLYWLLMSLAGWKALWEFVWDPFHWNKTQHGISKFTHKA